MYWNRKMRGICRSTDRQILKRMQKHARKDMEALMWLGQKLVDLRPPASDCSSCFGWWPNAPHRRDGRCAICWVMAARDAVDKENS